MRFRGEEELIGACAALIDKQSDLHAYEKDLISRATEFPPPKLEGLRKAIRAGEDPLGDAFCSIRSARDRRRVGAVYTPQSIVKAILNWAVSTGSVPTRIVDPGSGSGRFILAAGAFFPDSDLVAVESDPLAALMLRANADVLGVKDRLHVLVSDFREVMLPAIEGATLFIGNPPYVRHHQLPEASKKWFATTARSFGYSASKLSGLHVHFFLKTRQLAREGDYGAYITSAEWIDVNYGATVREMLADGLGGASLCILKPEAMPFGETLTTGAVTCFRAGQRRDSLTVKNIDSLDALDPLDAGEELRWADIAGAPRWSTFIRRGSPKPATHIEIGELFRVHRGQVTGNNAVWVEGLEAECLPERFRLPCVTKARELIAAENILGKSVRLKNVIDLPVDLNVLDDQERAPVEAFLAWAREHGAHQSYIARHRRAWWAVGLREPAPILCTYMARRRPAFVRNQAEARHLNIAHGLYPREPLSDAVLDAVCAYLRQNVALESGRTYAGGLTKFEPGEVARLWVPAIHELTAAVS